MLVNFNMILRSLTLSLNRNCSWIKGIQVIYFPKIKALHYKSEFLKECSQNMQTADLLCICFSINILFHNQIVNCHKLHHHWEIRWKYFRKRTILWEIFSRVSLLAFVISNQYVILSFVHSFIHSGQDSRNKSSWSFPNHCSFLIKQRVISL